MLIARAVDGDHRAFTIIAKRHGPRMAGTVRALGVAMSDVEDVTQSALIAAWKNLGNFKVELSLPAWLCVIAANKGRDWVRQRRVRSFWFGAKSIEDLETLNVGDDHDAIGIEERRELRRVAAAMALIPAHLRAPLVLVSAGGLTYREAASALGISHKALETRLARARKRLGELLADD